MRKKTKIIASFLLGIIICSKSISQDQKLFVTYKKKSILSESKKINDSLRFEKVRKFDQKQNDELLNVEFYLTCFKNESLFKVQDVLESDSNRWKKLSIKLGGGGDVIYTNFKTKEQLWEKEAFGSLFLVTNNIDSYNWKLINETKRIGKYLCHKAIGEKHIVYKGKKKKIIIKAWYSPELNYPFGPTEYCNLPGLILEIDDSNIKFYATKIEFIAKTNEAKIEKPTKGKKVTLKELIAIGNEIRSTRKF